MAASSLNDQQAVEPGTTPRTTTTTSTARQPPASKAIKSSAPQRPPLLDEAQQLLSISIFVYLFSDLRELSILGKTNIPFEDLCLESDNMNVPDIINGTPLTDPTGSAYGKSGIQIAYVVLRALADGGGLPPPPDSSNAKARRRSTLVVQEEGGKQGEAAKLDGLRFYESMFQKGLVNAPPKCGKVCCHHVGNTCKTSNLHYIQCFFDQLHEKATSGADDTFEDLWYMLEGKKESELRKTGRKSVIQNLDATLKYVVQNTFKPHAPMLLMVQSAQQYQNHYVWTNDRMSHRECVYSIAINKAAKSVYVVFRGTATWEDIMKNTDFSIFEMTNPIQEEYANKTPTVELNRGYSDYLFVPRVDTGRTKYDEILDRVHEFGKALTAGGGSGYTLCVCGHSLGGALAAMFGLFASADRKRPSGNAVRIFTYGSAIPGRISFAQAFQHQEYVGKVMHARFHNDGDIVPLMHPQLTRDFAQTGFKLYLQPSKEKDGQEPSKKIVFDYIVNLQWWSTLYTNWSTSCLVNFPWLQPLSFGSYHGLRSYVKAILLAKVTLDEDLVTMSLDEHYEEIRQMIRNEGKTLITQEEEDEDQTTNGD